MFSDEIEFLDHSSFSLVLLPRAGHSRRRVRDDRTGLGHHRFLYARNPGDLTLSEPLERFGREPGNLRVAAFDRLP